MFKNIISILILLTSFSTANAGSTNVVFHETYGNCKYTIYNNGTAKLNGEHVSTAGNTTKQCGHLKESPLSEPLEVYIRFVFMTNALDVQVFVTKRDGHYVKASRYNPSLLQIMRMYHSNSRGWQTGKIKKCEDRIASGSYTTINYNCSNIKK